MSAVMRLKTLQSLLQDLDGFTSPKLQYEQYDTPAHLAASALFTIETQYQSIKNCTVLDAGCGTGMWGIGAALLGAGWVTALDIDSDVFPTFIGNVEEMEITNIDVIQCDFLNSDFCKWQGYFDTVLMNPPFGTKNNTGIDMKFLRMGTLLSHNSVYSLHKSSTRAHIEKKIGDWGMNGSVIAEMKFEIPASYRFHKNESLDIEVDLWRLHHPRT